MTPSDHIKKAAVDNKKASTKFGALHFYFVPPKLPIPAGARMVNIIRPAHQKSIIIFKRSNHIKQRNSEKNF